MKASEIRGLSVEEIRAQLDEREEELANLKLQLSTHQLENPLIVPDAKREIARLKTVLREHELGIRSLPGQG
ncbi:50S ribosomal protein L29 [bacterium]|nr:50S ribosomal protein L29 [Gemmatimonadota bacterium]MCH2664583.1 50S ribosomal protein L29 [bacterium]HCK10910.1 50S ribosomal protein L29 [Candidatus Latescibacterota bacterium]